MTHPYEPQPGQGQQQPPRPPFPPQGGQMQPWQQPYFPPVQVAPKSVIGALVLSFFFPGVGSMYAGDVAWGIVILALWVISLPLILVAGIGLITGFVCWIAGMVVGAMDAQKWNREHGIIS